jgi:L,D-transpeptidase YcbB
MIKKTAVLTRAGFLPVAAALTLMCSSAARAEEPSASANSSATAAGQKPDGATAATNSAVSTSDKGANASVTSDEKKPEQTDHKATAAADKDKTPGAVAAQVPEPLPQKPAGAADKTAVATDKDTASKDKTPDTVTAKVPESQPQKPADSAQKTTATAAKDKSDSDTSAKDTSAKDTSAKDTSAKDKAQTGAATANLVEPQPEKSAQPAAKEDTTSNKEPAQTKSGAASGTKVPDATAALPAASSGSASAGVADAVLPPADPIVATVREKLPKALKGASEEETAALVAFYDNLNGSAIWVSTDGLTAKGKAVVKELGRADDWGLSAADFRVPQLTSGTLSPEAAADAEIEVARAVLKYARYARGGRINPASISVIFDVSPTLIPPKRVLADITILDAPDAYLRSLHPKHAQFELLRQALLKARGSTEKEEEAPAEDPALAVKLPPGSVIKPGGTDQQVALLRQRLKVAVEDKAKENVYDAKLQEAVREFQRANNLRPDAVIGNNTRAVLNGQPKPEPVTADSKIERILVNMERWRWLPEDLGKLYVWDNVPEALTRIVKDGKIIHTDKLVVGQPTWPTPSFSADMKTVVFHPTWGVPDGIKAKELAPLLRKSSGGGIFGLFGGGYSADAVLDAYQLHAYVNGHQVDANSIDWSSIDIRSVAFQQPPGPKNPLGNVKFMFPNKHDVYMHDTPEHELFSRSFRALSHGCMRVQDPRRFAEIILGEDKGWSPEKVRGMFAGGSQDVPLDTHIPVHVTYLTMRVDENGKLQTYGDFYGLDGRTAAALTGKAVRFEQPAIQDDVVASGDGSGDDAPLSGPPGQRRAGAHKKQYGAATLSDAITGLFSP